MRTFQQVGLRFSFRALIALGIVIAPATAAYAITINIEYTDEGDPVPHDENPDWDPDGEILKAHFERAKEIWESLLPGSGEYSFDFHWDDNIAPALGLTTDGPDTFIEINPNINWFADPTPGDDVEFTFYRTQFQQLSAADKATFFPGTPPPGTLEVSYQGLGSSSFSSASGVTGINASNGSDLLSTIVHEIGHVLGIAGIEPGEYNIFPEHVGGLNNVLVLEDNDSGHLAGDPLSPGFLMCDGCARDGYRRLPSATDVFVIAEDQGITNVRLERVDSISGGLSTEASTWIGGRVPDSGQDVEIRHGGELTIGGHAQAKNLTVGTGNTVQVGGARLSVASRLFYPGSVTVGSGGILEANEIFGNPARLTTLPGSLVRFNEFGSPVSTSASFNGSVAIGYGAGTEVVTFNPSAVAIWNVGQNLTIGAARSATLVIDNGAWSVGGNLDLQGIPLVSVGEVIVNGGTLDVAGSVTIGAGALTYKSHHASNTTYTLNGGTAFIKNVPPTPPFLVSTGAGRMTFESTSPATPVHANSAIINVEGGTGDGGNGAVVTFNGQSDARDAEFWNKSGVGGISLRISNPVVIAGTGGSVVFHDNSNATTAHFRNDGVAHHGPHGSGGATYFRDSSNALDADFDNYGSTLQSYTGAVPAPGGRTEFFDASSADFSTFNNHPGQGMGALGAGVTIFRGNSKAFHGTFYNKGGVPGLQHGGSTEFYDNATAGDATFYNERSPNLSQHSGSAGNVRFFGSSSAENAKFYNQRGGGSVFFNDSSTAGDGHFFIEDTNAGTFYGHVVFNGNSKGGTADLTIRENCNAATIEFRGASNAEQAQITLVNGSQAGVWVYNSASLGQANLDIASSNVLFRDSATAANSTIRFRPGGGGDFTGGLTTAANAIITLDGATVANGGTGSLNFTGGRAGNATIYVNGGTVAGAAGAQVGFNNGTNVGTATVIGGSGVAGAGGARINLDPSSTAANATFTIGAGGYLNLQGFGTATVGSLDVAGGAVHLGQTGLQIGALNTSNTISGPITGFFGNGNAKITKVGAGTLTLTGANTYYGLTQVDGGTLAINGTTPGAVEVNSGAMLMGTGSIGGTVTLNSGGTLAPGGSAGKITFGGLNLSSGSTLAMELGGIAAGTQYDQVISSGAFSLGGALNVSLVNGFAPSAGQSFNLFDWGTVSGTFGALSLPSLGTSLTWNTSQLYTTGVLSVVSAGIPGDFNQDNRVDAADYVLWRKNGGSQQDYNTWRAHFGQTAGGGTDVGSTAAVPEPGTLLPFMFAAVGWRLRRGRAE